MPAVPGRVIHEYIDTTTTDSLYGLTGGTNVAPDSTAELGDRYHTGRDRLEAGRPLRHERTDARIGRAGRPAPPLSSSERHPRGTPISHTSAMASGLGVGGDIEQALENVGVPSYVLDDTGVVRWINAAAERLVGDVRGRHFTSVVAPEDKRRARELFSQKVLGTSPATEATGILISTAGTRVAVDQRGAAHER